MKQITTSSLGFDVPVTNVPETIEEAATSFGSEQAVLDAAITYVRLHRTNTEVRDELCDRIAKATGVERTTKQIKSPTKDDPNRMIDEYDESEAEFAKRALAQAGKTPAELAPQILDGFSVEFQAKGEARTGAGRKLAQVYTNAANKLIELGQAAWDRAIATIEQANPGTTVERDENNKPKVESLANGIRVNQQRVLAEANATLGIAA